MAVEPHPWFFAENYNAFSLLGMVRNTWWLQRKGRHFECGKFLAVLNLMDFSINSLSSSDPSGVNRSFWFANPKSVGKSLSCGDIFEKFGELKLLESLSRNELVGSIPSSLVRLNFLSQLNLSLFGRMPYWRSAANFHGPFHYCRKWWSLWISFEFNVRSWQPNKGSKW